MNCQEVMDYMQRQLDGDLDGRETDLLLHHTRQCPDCAAMFERLKRLSAELENLPKVTPSYSLVDAIMPKLEQLELQRHSVKETELPADRPVPAGSRRKPQERKQRWTDRISFRAFGGVIAAGIVVGLFLVTYKPYDMRTAQDKAATKAEGFQLFSAGSSESSAANSAPKASESSADDSVKRMADKETADNKNKTAYTMENSPAAEEPTVSVQVTSGSSSKSDHQVTPSSPPANDEPVNNSEQDSSDMIVVDQVDQFGSVMNRNGEFNEEKATAERVEESELGIAGDSDASLQLSFAGPEPLESPDGAFLAVIEQDTVKIYNTSDNTVLFESSKSGSIANLVWSEDSATVTFEVTGENKTAERYRIDVKKKSEVKIAG